jgi:hypothetical protein
MDVWECQSGGLSKPQGVLAIYVHFVSIPLSYKFRNIRYVYTKCELCIKLIFTKHKKIIHFMYWDCSGTVSSIYLI